MEVITDFLLLNTLVKTFHGGTVWLGERLVETLVICVQENALPRCLRCCYRNFLFCNSSFSNSSPACFYWRSWAFDPLLGYGRRSLSNDLRRHNYNLLRGSSWDRWHHRLLG